MEDCDFFISKTSKTEYTQSASRLLNTLDGILGQGMDFLFILTANEDSKNVHEAFSRKGRCIANIPFEGLNQEEAKNWCDKHNVDISDLNVYGSKVGFRDNSPVYYSLADLYSLIQDDDVLNKTNNDLEVKSNNPYDAEMQRIREHIAKVSDTNRRANKKQNIT
jgi:hypothetical protein